MMRKLFLILFVFLTVGSVFGTDLSVILKTDKKEYVEGESIKISLDVNNLESFDILAQLSSKSVIGDSGFDISCYEFNFLKEQGVNMQIIEMPAMFSNSQTSTLTSFSSCGGSQSQSTQTIVDSSKVISSKDEEKFVLNPFVFKYSINGTDFEVKSNSVEIIVKKKTEEQKKQEEEQKKQEQKKQEEQQKQQQEKQKQQQQSQQQNQQSQGQQNQKQNNQDNQGEQKKLEGLNQQQKQALSQNQQNSQTLNQLKNEINKLDINESKIKKENLSLQNLSLNQNVSEMLNDDKKLEKKKSNFFYSFLGFLIVILLMYFIYVKYLKKENLDEISEAIRLKKVPYYLELLDSVLVEKVYKNQIKILAQSVREYLKFVLKLDFVPTNLKALRLSGNLLFVKILKKAEGIEFARSQDKLNVEELVKKLRMEYNKNEK